MYNIFIQQSTFQGRCCNKKHIQGKPNRLTVDYSHTGIHFYAHIQLCNHKAKNVNEY